MGIIYVGIEGGDDDIDCVKEEAVSEANNFMS